MASLGTGLTGEENPTQAPLKNIVSGAGTALNRAIFDDPASRSALLQIGLQLMQPTSIGQTTGGAFAQGIGEGGEAAGRIEAANLKERQADDKLSIAEQGLKLREQDIENKRLRAEAGQSTGLTATLQYQAQQNERRLAVEERKQRTDWINKETDRIATRAKGIAADKLYEGDEEITKYRNMTRDAIKADVARKYDEEHGPPQPIVTPELRPTIRGPQTTAPVSTSTTLPPPNQRKVGETRTRRGNKNFVWGNDDEGNTGWIEE